MVKSGERYKYALADFDSANNIAILKRVDGAIRNNIHLFEHNLVGFSENFSPKHREDGWVEKWSIDDVGNKTFVNILLRDSIVSISPSYPVSYKKVEILQGDNRSKDNKIKALESDRGSLQSENGELKTRISNQEKDIESKGITIKQQNVVINEQKGAIISLETERTKLSTTLNETRHQIERLKEELRQAQNNRDDETLQKCLVALKSIAQKRAHTDHLIDSISPRLKKAEENIEHIDNQLNKKRLFKLTSQHLFLGGLVIVAIIAIMGIVMPTQNHNKYDTVTKSVVRGMINETLRPINKALDDISKKVNNMEALTYSFSASSSDVTYNPNSYSDKNDASDIDYISIVEGNDFVCGKTYTIRALKKKDDGKRIKLKTGGGQFIIELANGHRETLQSTDNGITSSVKIKDDWAGECLLIYSYQGSEIKQRKVTIKQQ